jgi:transcriptional regulator
VGKVLLASLDRATLDRLFNNVKLERFTKNTPTDKAALYRRLQTIREVGYGTDEEEYTIGVRCVAVPIRDQRGHVIAAMSVSVPVIRFDEDISARALALLLTGAAELSAALGYRETPNWVAQPDRSSSVRPTRASPGLSAAPTRTPGAGPVIIECGGVRRPVRGGRRPFRRR